MRRAEHGHNEWRLVYAPSVSVDLWLGAVTTLAGAALGGTISFVLNRQQIRDARAQRVEEDLRIRHRRSTDRRFDAFSGFFTNARSYRTALRPFAEESASKFSVQEMDALARAADSASSLVFIVLESEKTYRACRQIVDAIDKTQKILRDGTQLTSDEWLDRGSQMAQLLRSFQIAIREELGVGGIEESLILYRKVQPKEQSSRDP